jgi:hypothetical protein
MSSEDPKREIELMEELIRRNQEAIQTMRKSVEILKKQLA